MCTIWVTRLGLLKTVIEFCDIIYEGCNSTGKTGKLDVCLCIQGIYLKLLKYIVSKQGPPTRTFESIKVKGCRPGSSFVIAV